MPVINALALSTTVTTERLRQIESLVINFPRLNRVREQLAWCQQHSRLTADQSVY